MFVICGEALIDMFLEDNAQQDTFSLQACVGGSPFNVAIGLARLGQQSSLLTGLSNDMFGKRLQSILKMEGVSQELIVEKELPTTIAFIEKDEDGIPSYSFLGQGAADRSLLLQDVDLKKVVPIGIHIGSYTIVTQPTADTFLSLVREYSGQCLISLDPNVRSIVEPDMTIWKKRVDELVPLADIVKVSDEDLMLMYPDLKPESIIEKWLATGLKMVVLTRGGEGSTLWSKQGKVDVEAPKTRVIDTVGAGDTYQAALLDCVGKLIKHHNKNWHAHLSLEKLEEIGTFAAAAAAITCSRQGANLPTKAEVNDYLN